ncbi:MAG: hypothetical protein HC839_05960 [Leptolyngbyaceae cyanobacterium RM2_2_21]|nr:hypothetical protein [Leptolyngbyaceae cyanobacterium RM2_2_21]
MSQRLGEDHLKAQRLAQGIATVSGLVIDPSVVQTNMVFFTLADTVPLTAQELVNKVWQTAEIKLGTYGDRKLRAVTHYWIQPDHVDALVNTLKAVLK